MQNAARAHPGDEEVLLTVGIGESPELDHPHAVTGAEPEQHRPPRVAVAHTPAGVFGVVAVRDTELDEVGYPFQGHTEDGRDTGGDAVALADRVTRKDRL